jgi:hypothetical protein
MTKTQETQFIRMFTYLREITKYQTPDQLRRGSRKEYGLEYEEALEFAYENVINTAKQAIKGIKMPKVREG